MDNHKLPGQDLWGANTVDLWVKLLGIVPVLPMSHASEVTDTMQDGTQPFEEWGAKQFNFPKRCAL